jgi:hypothetical protein
MTSINQYLFACPYVRPSWCFKVVHDRFCPEIRNEIITCMNVSKERKITVAVAADPNASQLLYILPQNCRNWW